MKKIILTMLLLTLIWGEAKASARYISLAPSTTEILFALGLDEEIVGVSSYCDFPAQAKTKPKVGNFSSPNMEKILSLRPDHIFCTGLEQAPAVRELKRMGLNVYVAYPNNIEELFATIEDIGRITGKSPRAAELIRVMRNDIEEVAVKVRDTPPEKRVKVFIEFWHEPLMTAGSGSLIDELITLAGGINIAHEINRPFSNFSAEKVLRLDPGCIILAYMDKEAPLKLVAGRFGWENIEAVKNGRVFNDIDPNILLRPGPRVTLGLKEIYKRLYPQRHE
jgi:iron complex transport system substrate-binding protein